MKPHFRILPDELIDQIIEEALQLLVDPGVRVHNEEALKLLAEAGARVNFENQIAYIPEELVRKALETAPSDFSLYTVDGEPAVHYGGDTVQFNPCSTALNILDSKTQKQRQPMTADMVKFVKLVEALPQLDAQSTALVCGDVPMEIADLYRLYIALHYMRKPIVTGAFSKETLSIMKSLLVTAVGDEAELAAKPRAVFDVCPSPPLLWSDFTCQNLIDCARSSIPTQLISMPLTGATAPVTLAAAVVQHAAENMSGVTICQLAKEGAPIVWGGSPSGFDMRHGTTPMGAVETWMIDAAFVEVGKALQMPTNAYLGLSDAKVVDAQCGLEASGGILMAALVGVNMVSSPGMLDFESCQSFEKVVIDAEIIGMARRLIAGIEVRESPIALTLMREMGHRGDYLSQSHTHRWFKKELYAPSEIIDRSSYDEWERNGAKTAFERASDRVEALVNSYEPVPVPEAVRAELHEITLHAARQSGMDNLPDLSNE
jgi:trimethylamine---corrinoid protein Co-methyltransferase